MTPEATAAETTPHAPGVTVRAATCRPPLLAETVVARPGLIARLVDAPAGTLVAVTAPPGYGKTIVAAQWDLADHRPFAWVNLDALDDDPAHLVAHIATALADRDLLDAEDLRFLSAPGRSPLHDLLPAMFEMLDRSDPFVLVIDDVHLLRREDARATLAAVVDAVPTAGVLALLSRTPPLVGLARRRLRDGVLEIGPDELALTLDESARVFAGLGARVPAQVLADVQERCEGWAGGIHLSALALRDRDGAPIAPVTGRNRLLADYLVEEVLNGIDPDTACFLEEASILEPMSARLLDDVLGRTDSGRKLAQVEASGNLFLVPLDEERTWYRFHHLFGELLSARLDVRDPSRMTELHRRASEVHEAGDDLDEAIRHAVLAGDHRRAAALVQRDAIAVTFAGRPGVLARRLSLLDEATLTGTPDGAIARAWNAVADGDVARGRAAVADALRCDAGDPLADGSSSVAVAAGLIGGFTGEGGLDGVLASCTFVIQSGDPATNPWWAVAMTVRATALLQLGRYHQAEADLLQAVDRVPGIPGFEAGALMLLAWLRLRDGDLVSASRYADVGRVITDHHELAHVVPLLVVYSTSALVSARSGDHARARRDIASTNTSLARLGESSPRTRIFGHQVLAEAEHILQNGVEARRHLDEAARIYRQHPLSAALGAENDRIRALLDGGPAGSSLAITPLTAAERRVLPLLATHLSLPQIAGELKVSRNTVKTHCVAVYRKLGVTSRSEAVTEARRLGLIEA